MKSSDKLDLYKYAVKLVGKEFDPKKIDEEAKNLLMQTYMGCASADGEDVRIKIKYPRPKKLPKRKLVNRAAQDRQ